MHPVRRVLHATAVIILLLALPIAAFAQEATIIGKITDSSFGLLGFCDLGKRIGLNPLPFLNSDRKGMGERSHVPLGCNRGSLLDKVRLAL